MIPSPTITTDNPEFRRAVDMRAVALCAQHNDGTFDRLCPDLGPHWLEARRLLAEYERQGG